MAKREIEFTTRLTREDVAGLIEALIEGLKDGKLKIKKSNEELELLVPRVIDLEIEASVDDERAEFEIEISWRTNRAENPDSPPEDSPGDAEEAPEKAAAKAPAARKKTTAKAKATKSAATAAASKSSKTSTRASTGSAAKEKKSGAKNSAASKPKAPKKPPAE